MAPPTTGRDDRPTRARRRPGAWLAAGVVCAVAALSVRALRDAGTRVPGTGGERLGPGAAVTRGATRIAGIERVTPARGRGRLPLYLAPARGPVIDSARVGVLAARLLPRARASDPPVIGLVPRDSVVGMQPVGRLVVVPGEPGLLVFGPAGRDR